MKKFARLALDRLIRPFGYQLALLGGDLYFGLSAQEAEYCRAVSDRTMVKPADLIQSIRCATYVARNRIPGALVECGVWRGGVVMAMLQTLMREESTPREVFCYDTFEGLPPPGEEDKLFDGRDAKAIYAQNAKRGWCAASLDDVREGVLSVGYPGQVHFVKGKVEDTIPGTLPGKIALLRLDTDWYDSTRHELIHLWPLLSPGGVLIIDDYGTWAGARKAADEFLDPGLLLVQGKISAAYVVKP